MVARLLFCAAALSGLTVLAIFGFLLWFSLPLFHGGMLLSLFSWQWRPTEEAFGILPMVAGSLCLAVSAMLIAFPVGVGLCGFIHGIGPSRLARPLLGIVRFMTSIPTVVYGLVSAFLLVPLLRDGFSGSGFSWLAALLTLALLVLPTIVLVLDNQFRLLHEEMHLSAMALGLSRAQQFLRLTLPLSRHGLLMALALGFGRAIGDTMISLMLAGNAPQLPHSLLDSIRTLTAHIALVVSTDSQSMAYGSLFACGLMLFGVSVGVNVVLYRLRQTNSRQGERYV
ncbi:ABC transporter permease subunit [Oxalobacter vibrioformis]|uniref:ABC transporter permease subunit n=1 Tax=Oxalobacter vibrioformis TaxID=933080 RepID=A0A9E9LYU3_9BURK|nr:ABC transporter permease subunit [Oxalobacter vibrioformis]WAW10029.1 ABC transporter permease subunit [Oxalobacter vibrioformis]